MELIDKSAIVAEINRRIKEHHSGYLVCLKDILSLLDTLEVKEVGVDLGDPKGDKSAKYIIDTKTLEVKEVQEEPISENLEEAAKFYAATHTEFFDSECKPHVTSAFIAGAEWQKEQTIEKACDWLLKNDSYAKPTEVLVRDFRKAMEGEE